MEKEAARSNGHIEWKLTDAENGNTLVESPEEESGQTLHSLPQISPYITIPIWICLSGGTVIFNQWILSKKNFSFPLFLTAYHMVVMIIGTNVLRYTTNLLAPAAKPLPSRLWTHAIIPIALLYFFSLVLSNAAHVHLSLSLVQMIKASVPVLLHLISCAAGLARMDKFTAIILLAVSSGCVIATAGELRYDSFGLACQIGAAIAEASRLLVMQVLLQGIKMNPLVSLHYYAPTCLVFIGSALPFLEGTEPFYTVSHLGWHILLSSGLLAFALNVSSVFLISSSGSMVPTLSGVFTDIILICLSVLLLGSAVSGQQMLGYGIALIGLILFRNKDRIVLWRETVKSSSSCDSGLDSIATKAATKPLIAMRSSLLDAFRCALHSPPSASDSLSDGKATESGDEEATGSQPKWSLRWTSNEQRSNNRIEPEFIWRPAGRRNRTQFTRAVGLLLAIFIVRGSVQLIGPLFELRPGALQSLRTSLGLPIAVAPAEVAQAVTSSGVTVVSGFFKLTDGKKHSFDDYYEWIKNFLSHPEQPIVFFTSPDLVDMILDLRQGKPIHVISDYESAWDMPPLQQLGGAAWGEAMNKIDPEQWMHVAGVYAPWTAKPWMVQHAKDINVFNSNFFCWMDAGGFREPGAEHHMRVLPERFKEIYAIVPNDTIVLGDASVPWPDGTDYVKEATLTGEMDRTDAHIQGGWFGGPPAALDWWAAETLRVTQIQSGLQRFSGKEQDVWTHTARLFWRKIYVQNMYLNNGQCGDFVFYAGWWAYEYWADSKNCEIPVWNGPELWKKQQEEAAAEVAAADAAVASSSAFGAEIDSESPSMAPAVALVA